MSEAVDEVARLLEEVVRHWTPARRTFTETEAMQPVWDAYYEIMIQSDPRFVLVHEGDGTHPPHWRLVSHTVANTRLLHELLAGTWDGRDLEGKVAELDAQDQQHYVFYPLDARFTRTRQGILEPAEQERNVKLRRGMKATLDALGPKLLAHWQEAGAEPWTVRRITEGLRQLAWADAELPNAWLYVRTWLLTWPQVRRVGQDYWIPAEQVPSVGGRTRLHVHPLRVADPVPGLGDVAPVPRKPPTVSSIPTTPAEADESQVVLRGEVVTERARWTVRLRTINLLEGFLSVPSAVRGIYPPPVPGEGPQTALRGMWHEDGSQIWLWLDRTHHRLYGHDLAGRLTWLDAGTVLRIEWAPDVIVFQRIGQDEAVRNEEERLVDLEALAALRGGLGENYRRSLQAILAAAPDGLTFAEVVIALRERQQHEVHRGTIHALLSSGGFVRKDRRWFAAPDPEAGARRLRAAFVETLLPAQQETPALPLSAADAVRTRVNAIHTRLAEIVARLREEHKSSV